jgi:hypothetical protein
VTSLPLLTTSVTDRNCVLLYRILKTFYETLLSPTRVEYLQMLSDIFSLILSNYVSTGRNFSKNFRHNIQNCQLSSVFWQLYTGQTIYGLENILKQNIPLFNAQLLKLFSSKYINAFNSYERNIGPNPTFVCFHCVFSHNFWTLGRNLPIFELNS